MESSFKSFKEWHDYLSQYNNLLDINPLTGKTYKFGEKEGIITIDSLNKKVLDIHL